jgi:hypothetical protein
MPSRHEIIFWIVVCILMAFAAFMISSCSCEREPIEYGTNNLTITYKGYSDVSRMLLDCDWDAKNLTCEKYYLNGSTCHLFNCIGNKPATIRSCGGTK